MIGEKRNGYKKRTLKWLLATRKEYIKCYYLHLAVDNIYENKGQIKGGRETIENCINSWEKNRAVIVPGTEPYLRDVLGFLRNNVENIRLILFSC